MNGVIYDIIYQAVRCTVARSATLEYRQTVGTRAVLSPCNEGGHAVSIDAYSMFVCRVRHVPWIVYFTEGHTTVPHYRNPLQEPFTGTLRCALSENTIFVLWGLALKMWLLRTQDINR